MLNPAENRKIWMKAAEDSRELLEGRVKNDIEKYRKGYCKLRLTDAEGRPIKTQKLRSTSFHTISVSAQIFLCLKNLITKNITKDTARILKNALTLQPFRFIGTV